MNRKSVVLALVALLVLPAALTATPTAAEEPEGTVYLALGDSLAWGQGATDRLETAYVPHFYRFLQGDKHSRARELVNLAIGGETSTSFIAGGQLTDALGVIMQKDVEVVTLDIGGNDLLELLASGPCAEDPTSQACMDAATAAMQTFAGNYAYSLGAIAGTLAARPGEHRIIVMTYYNPWSGTGQPIEAVLDAVLLGGDGAISCGNPAGWGMNDIITCVAGNPAFGGMVSVADVYPRFVGKGLELTHIAEGDIHANDAGYAQIASVFRATYLDR